MAEVAAVAEEEKEVAAEDVVEEGAVEVVEGERKITILDPAMQLTTLVGITTIEAAMQAIGMDHTTRTILEVTASPANHLSQIPRKTEKRERMPTLSRKKHEFDLPRFSWTFGRTKAKPSANFLPI